MGNVGAIVVRLRLMLARFGGRLGACGRLARDAALGRGDTPILAFPREGGRDLLASVWAWFGRRGWLTPDAG